MSTRFSRLFLAGGQNAVPFSGWFLGGWSPGTTLAIFWFENLVLTVLLAARIAAHWSATRKRGHQNGFLPKFLLTSLAFTLAHGLFLSFILFAVMEDSVNRDDLIAGVQWMLLAQGASLLIGLWFIGNWPFAEVRARVDWMMGREVVAHLSILFGMFAFMAMGQPWLSRAVNKLPRAPNSRLPKDETFEQHWERATREEAARSAHDEEVVSA